MRVLIAGQVRIYREALSEGFMRGEGYEVVGTAASAADALLLAIERTPDVVVLDIGLPQIGALARELSDRSRKVVVVGINEADEAIMQLIEEGISGYVARDGSLADLLAALDGAVSGESLVSPRVVSGMMRRLATLQRERRTIRGQALLTSREREIATLIDEGLSNRDIARHLQIELPTVKNHVHNILEKMQVHRRGEAVARLRASADRPILRRHDAVRQGTGPK